MKPIVQLDQSLVNKIAAGEVVERPLSVVKELTENAIDAGATVITVEIAEGGLSQIRVTDNGGGIPAEDLELAFSRHATSKIASLDDLFGVQTLGFRGEALSSIAAVAQVEMITKTPYATMGTRVEIHGGKILSSQKIGCANGTTVVVGNLFYNTPARRKFLKKPTTEAGYISDCLERLALGNPGLTLRYINNGKIIFQTNGNGDLKTALLNIYGRDVAIKVVPVDAADGVYCLSGLIGKPEIARGNRQHASFFINGRYIQSKLLSNAVEQAMRTMLPQGKFPLYALNLVLPFDMLDVNVHPTKMDVRFADEDAVFAFVETAVREALTEQNLIPSAKPRVAKKDETLEPEQLPIPVQRTESPSPKRTTPSTREVENALREMYLAPSKAVAAAEKSQFSFEKPSNNKATFGEAGVASATGRLENESVRLENEALPPADKKPSRFASGYNIVGLVFNTYWLVTEGESLFLIDQHAAHERILYERFLENAKNRKVESQQLLIPIPLRLTPREKQLLTDNLPHFQNFGFEIDAEEFAIIAVPFLIKGPPESGFFADLLDKIDQVGFSKESLYDHKTELIAMASCKAAVKGGDGLTEQEAKALVTQLMELENPFTCPHGRPTIIEITKQELEKRFKRS